MPDLISLNQLKVQTPSQVRSAIEQVSDKDFNWWLAVYDLAYTNTFPMQGQVNLDWAEVVIEVCQQLMGQDTGSNSELNLMNFKARLISTCGYTDLVPLASIQEIINWFMSSLPLSYEEVNRLTPLKPENLNPNNLTVLRQLRDIKNKLKVIQSLREHPQVEEHPDLQKWLELHQQLP